MYNYYYIYKPFGMLSQFSPEGNHATLANLEYSFPKNVYPVGRLDADSEGLLILTNDGSLNNMLLNPLFAHERSYLVQVDGTFTPEAKIKVEKGTEIKVDGKSYHTLPAKVIVLIDEPTVFERTPPIRFRKNIPTSWIQITLIEGKNRQVRKMTASVGFPTLRLIRISISSLNVLNLKPGGIKEIEKNELFQLLHLNK
jgi:23S rRNA pseudouridine2457 synthase